MARIIVSELFKKMVDGVYSDLIIRIHINFFVNMIFSIHLTNKI